MNKKNQKKKKINALNQFSNTSFNVYTETFHFHVFLANGKSYVI